MDSLKDDNPSVLDFWAEIWIGAFVLILLSCSVFSLFSLLRFGAWAGGLGSLVWTAFRTLRAGRSAFAVPRFHGIGWGIPVLVSLCLVSLLVGPHCFLDSYSYRIPQMFFWLQEGHPWSVPNVDMRINQMPHVWPMLSAAFYLPLGERALALPNFLSLLLLSSLFRQWAHRAMGDDRKADAAALIFLSAPVFLMGGTTNDNVVTCVSFLALSLHFSNRFDTMPAESPTMRRRALALSAIAFALCCGIKPQYLVLAPLWALWFFFAPSRPWKSVSPRFLAILLPVLLLCSPVPTFAVNQFRWGSYSSPWVEDSVDPQPRPAWKAPKRPVSESVTFLARAMLSPPIDPAFSHINRMIEGGNNVLARSLRYVRWTARPFDGAEGASFGLWTFLAFAAGLLLARRRPKNCSAAGDSPDARISSHILPLSVLPFLALAIWMTRAGTLGRSFIGFFVLMIPCSVAGLTRLSKRTLAPWAIWCALNGAAVVVLDPALPLWPVSVAVRVCSDRPALRHQLENYARYSCRQDSSDALLAVIPDEETTIGLLVEAGEPIAEAWLRRPDGTRVIPYPLTVTADRLAVDGVRFLVVKDAGLSRYFGTADWIELLAIQTGLRPIRETSAVTYIQKGPETWTLFAKAE